MNMPHLKVRQPADVFFFGLLISPVSQVIYLRSDSSRDSRKDS